MRAEAKLAFSAAYIQLAARLTVRFGRIPAELTGITQLGSDHFCQGFYTDFVAAADVDWLRTVVIRGCEGDAFSSVFHIQEFAGRRAISPEDNMVTVFVLGFDHAANQRRDDVRT